MPTEVELLAMLKTIHEAPPCPAHGREGLMVCPYRNGVDCQLCRSKVCQCWNDE